MNRMSMADLGTLNAKTEEVYVVIETPQGSRNKFKYDPKQDLFTLQKVLPAGAVFPYDFGFLPSTSGEDGDPLDVLVLMDQATYPGILVTARLIGAIEAEQTERGETKRNDRLIAIASECHQFQDVTELSRLDANLLTQIEHFFVSYNEIEGKKFQPIGRANAIEAQKLLKTGRKRFDKLRK